MKSEQSLIQAHNCHLAGWAFSQNPFPPLPRRVGTEWSTTEGVNPKSTRLIEQVTILIYVAPQTTSWNSLVENIVDPATCMGSCSSANSRGMPITTQGMLSPHKDPVISGNSGGGVHHWQLVSSCHDSTFWVGVGGGFATWVVSVGFDCLMPQAAVNNPLAWALQLLLWLCSQGIAGSVVSDILEDVILTQMEGGASSWTSALVNVARDSMAHQSSSTLSTSWWGLPGIGGWAFSTQYWRALA